MFGDDAFRVLRDRWFVHHLLVGPHERVWESEAEESARVESNVRARAVFDLQTDGILRGESFVVAPLCLADLSREEIL